MQALSGCVVITHYIHGTTWLPRLCKYNVLLCRYWQMKRTSSSVAAFTLTQILLLNFTQSAEQVLAVTPHLQQFLHLQTRYNQKCITLNLLTEMTFQINSCPLLVVMFLVKRVVLLFPPHSHRFANLRSERNQVN